MSSPKRLKTSGEQSTDTRHPSSTSTFSPSKRDHGTSWPENYLKAARLILSDGRQFSGVSFGDDCSVSGEVVFNTGMVGYPESLTDPSYRGQLLVLTYPLVGNYGVPGDEKDSCGVSRSFEGDRIYATGLIVADYSVRVSHWTSHRTLREWLQEQQITAIAGIDTRAVTKHIRSHGSMLGKILIDDGRSFEEIERSLAWDDPNERNLVAEVSYHTVREFSNYDCSPLPAVLANLPSLADLPIFRILLVDCGLKYNMIRFFLYKLPHKIHLKVVPWDYAFADEEFDGLFISNGPGDPKKCGITIENIRKTMKRRQAIMGVCFGHQLLALAAGANTYKMKFGNRGMNQPVIDTRNTRCYITSQNHGYAVDAESLPPEWMQLFVNANDRSNEGIIHRHHPWMGVQFHPEASGGPTDTAFLFKTFLNNVITSGRFPVSFSPMVFPSSPTKVLLLGSGGLSIGQAGEFDYSGSQAIKALKEANLTVILVNPNIATVQTSRELADKVYFLPVNVEFITQVIIKERPDGILCTFGGQTALNCAIELKKLGILEKYNCEVLGTPIQAIIETEDRQLFAEKLKEINESCADSRAAKTIAEALNAAEEIGYPVLVRAGFALGGLGSGFAKNSSSLKKICKDAFSHCDQILIDKSLKGWKEVEYEVIRDAKDNCITVCNMENFDPLGIHTGDSIVIAPSQTLSNTDYYVLRETALKVIRHFGVIGECNIQFALDPHSDKYCIVEVNARLSRSSALASKATGYPLAYIAAKLSLGIDLLHVRNAVTRVTTACCEPSLDYVVTKIPRWDLRKFGNVEMQMGSAMKSVGEVMAIGRTFEESFQKALRMVENSLGFDGSYFTNVENICEELEYPSPQRIWAIAKAFDLNYDIDDLHNLTHIDRWFLVKLKNIYYLSQRLRNCELPLLTAPFFRNIKKYGFSDKQIASLLKTKVSAKEVRHKRLSLDVTPFVKQIDTLAAEFPAQTNYLYLTYQASEHDIESLSVLQLKNQNNGRCTVEKQSGIYVFKQSGNRLDETYNKWQGMLHSPSASPTNRDALAEGAQSFIVLGCGCYRIGSSVEFDWSAVSCVKTLRQLGHEAVIVNCNPETVSTDYDESDRLYFEELSVETILDIWEFEQPLGVIISVGGQTPNTLAGELRNAGVNILGTPVESIDRCENRNEFSKLCDSLGIDQPEWSTFTSVKKAFEFCEKVHYPVLVRPSYVLSGDAMKVVMNEKQLESFLKGAAIVSPDYPVIITKYIEDAKEVEMDSVACDGNILNFAITEHVENAGVHSGDATLILPAHKLYVDTVRQVKRLSQKLAKALRISGPFNIQFLSKKNELKIIECNLRASRTFPFISKTYNVNLVEQATRVMVHAPVRVADIDHMGVDYVGVKVPVFSFSRLRGTDPMLGVEMRSTGEVACFGTNKYEAFLKALISTGFQLPQKNILLSIGPLDAKVKSESAVRTLASLGYTLYATTETYNFLDSQFYGKSHNTSSKFENININNNNNNNNAEIFLKLIDKPKTGNPQNAVTLIQNGSVELVVNISKSLHQQSTSDGFLIRRAAIDSKVSLITNLKVFLFFVDALERKYQRESENGNFWEIKAWDEYLTS